MRAFVLKLVEQLVSESRTLSRNRHFDTFNDPLGRWALRVSKHLRALEREILETQRRGQPATVSREERDGTVVIRLDVPSMRARRVAYLSPPEFEILLGRPGVREALGQ
jgi:hypothetical protein